MPKQTEFWHAARQAAPDATTGKRRARQRLACVTRIEHAKLGKVSLARLRVVPKGAVLPQSFALASDPSVAWRPVKAMGLPIAVAVSRVEEALTVLTFPLPARQRCWGLGERYGGMNLRSRVHTLLTTDDHRHLESTDSLYKSIPVLYLVDGQRAIGLFLDSPAPQRWDLDSKLDGRGTIELFSRRGFCLYAIGPAPLPDVVAAYTTLTGRTPRPPRWSLGHQQSRWSYPSEARVREIAAAFRRRRIPCDTLVLDIDYMQDYRNFTISRERFPSFDGMVKDLASHGFHVVPIVDPGIKKSSNDAVYVEGMRRDVFCRTSAGKPFVGRVWPGRCCFPDFLRDDVRRFWGEKLLFLLAKGVGGIWNDMNEPALFDQQRPFDPATQMLPKQSDQLFLQTSPEGSVGHLEVRGLYGMQMARAAFEAQRAARPNERAFTLTRSTYAGGQRYGAVWLGDNMSWFEHLRHSIPMLLNIGLCGFAFAGVDIGGFGGHADAELLLRWYQTGIFYPFFRNHCALGQRSQEPWAFGPKVERAIRRLIRARYSLTQYIEQLFVEHLETGAPIMRPMAWHYPKDAHARQLDDQFLFGADLLVAPILARGKTERIVYLPEGTWEPFDGGGAIRGPIHHAVRWGYHSVPAFVRHGAILPMLAPAEHTGQLDRGTVVLRCFGESAKGRLWLDDGSSLAYERGTYDDWRLQLDHGQFTLEARHLGKGRGKRRVCVEIAGRRIPIEFGHD
jgi:alpha-glucosidase